MFTALKVKKEMVVFDGHAFRKCTFVIINDSVEVMKGQNDIQIRVNNVRISKKVEEDVKPGSISFLIIDIEQPSLQSQIIGCASQDDFYEDPTPGVLYFFA